MASEISFTDNFTLIIAGKKVSSQRTLDVINPSTEEVVASVPVATPQQLDEAIDAAAAAFPKWAATPLEERKALLRKMAELLEKHTAQFADLVVKETGKTRTLAGFEAAGSVHWLQGICNQSLEEDVLVDTPERKVVTRHVPLGVCAAIIPWNFPLSLLVWKVAPALMVGNCLLVKPSPFAPLATMKFVELGQQVFPPGVLSILTGDDELGPWISSHPRIAKVSLTGSTVAGKSVMKSASEHLTRFTLELGGNDPAIVMDDVDPKALAPQLFWGAFTYSGQICVAIKRIYVHEKVYNALLDEMIAFAKTVKVGDGFNTNTGIGPIQNKKQFDRVLGLMQDCRDKGYKFVVGGGKHEGKGYFVPISIVDNPPDNARLVQEEAFGPLLPLLKWTDEEDVIKRANTGIYGLGASVWGSDLERAERIGSRLEAGTVWINEVQQFHWDQPFGGFKQSGVGVEHSKHGLYSWTNIQSITLKKTVASKF